MRITIEKELTRRRPLPGEISKLENIYKISLPIDYRLFLEKYNGGRPMPDVFHFVEDGRQSDSLVDWFFCLDSKDRNYGLIQNLIIYRDRYPDEFFPIACDPFGNLVMLCVKGDNYGKVYFWNHENESMDEPWYDNIHIIADSFSDFIDMLV